LFSKSFRHGLTVILITVLCISCERKTEKKYYTLKKRTVYEIIPDTLTEFSVLADPDTSYLEHVFKSYDLVNVASLDSTIVTDLRYADTNNFLGRDFYDGLRNAYFTCDLAIRLCNAQFFLHEIDSSLSLVVLDAARQLHIQQMMWDSLDMLPDKKYIYLSPPSETSMHNYGCAADVSIKDADGNFLDMGSEYDSFQKLSQPLNEDYFRRSGQLSEQSVYNRKVLRYIMKRAGLRGINTEWWHFALGTKTEAASQYELIR
jgi:D-alanyl-D-alanine dipeptidase